MKHEAAMAKFKRAELARLIDRWFLATAGNPNRWSQDPVGSAIRSALQGTGNWKNAPRGNPRKGFEAQQSRKVS